MAEAKDLRDCLDALEKLKVVRRELKVKLSRDDLEPEKETRLADELHAISAGIEKLEAKKIALARGLS